MPSSLIIAYLSQNVTKQPGCLSIYLATFAPYNIT